MNDPFATTEHLNNPFKNSRGIYRVQSMFYDMSYDADTAVYVLRDKPMSKDGKEFPSLKQLYLDFEDVTEYEFATTYLDGWKHWKALQNNPHVMSHIEEWREELEVKLRAKAIRSIMSQAQGDKASYQAAKFLADRQWIKRGVGAPSKDEVEGEKRKQAKISSELDSHIARMKDYH